MEKPRSDCTDFHEICYLSIFTKTVKKIQVSLTSDKNNKALYMKTNMHFLSSLSCSKNEKCYVEKIKKHTLYAQQFLFLNNAT